MKKYIYTLLLGLITFSLFAQTPHSQRNIALGSIIDGEWEKIYDPIELNFYDKNYFFTQLADYTDNTYYLDGELQINDNGNILSEYPFGYCFTNPFSKKLKHSFFIRLKNIEQQNVTTNSIETLYLDSNNDDDNLIDYKIINSNSQKNNETGNDNLYFMMNNTLNLTDAIAGLQLIVDLKKQSSTRANSGFSDPLNNYIIHYGDSSFNSTTSYYFIENNLKYFFKELCGDFNIENKVNNYKMMFSYQKPYNNKELRGDLSFNLANDNHNTIKNKIKYTSINMNFDNSVDDEYTELSSYQNRDFELTTDSFETMLNLCYRVNSNDNPIRHLQDFFSVSLGLGAMFGNEDILRKTETGSLSINNQGNSSIVSNKLSESNTDTSKGDFNGVIFNLSTKYNKFINEYVCFGFGSIFDITKIYKDHQDIRNKKSNQILQNGTSDQQADDLIKTINQTISYKTIENITINKTTIPIGLEFKLPKSDLSIHDSFSLRNFAFRLGSIYSFSKYKNKNSSEVIDSELSNGTITNGLGQITEYYDDNLFLANQNYSCSSNYYEKIFTLGIGYTHSDNLNIDLATTINKNTDNYYIGASFTIKI